MTKFILHGGYTSVQNEHNDGFFKEIVRDISDGGQVLIVYFARNEDEYEKLFEQDTQQFEKAANGKKLKLALADMSSFIDQVKSSSAIYIRGGETQRLLEALRHYPNFASVIRGKTVAGSSAGAYVLATNYDTNSKKENRKGLAILPLNVMCHFHNNFEALDELKRRAPELETITLKNYEYKVVLNS